MAAKPSGNKSVLVIGLGRFGGSVAATLDQMGQDVLAVDKNPELVARWSAHLPTIQADMTDVLAIEQIDASQFDTAVVAIGDTVRVHLKVKEGNRERIQVFEGTVIAKKHGGLEETFTVRRVSYGVGVEKVFPVHAPSIEKIETVRHGKVRRAKLYYLRDRVGKSAKIKEAL